MRISDWSSDVCSSDLPVPLAISKLRVSWKMNGFVKGASSETEKIKEGDDFPLRIGLMIKGSKPIVPFFAPAWAKALGDLMVLPSNHMVYFVLGAKSSPGEIWKSPFSNSIETRAVQSIQNDSGWSIADQTFSPIEVVGLWIMGDGDNTKSVFSASVNELVLE